MNSYGVTTEMKATFFSTVFVLYKVVITLESVDEIHNCDYSNKSH